MTGEQTAEPTPENQTVVLNFSAWDAATMAAFVTACEGISRTLRRFGKHESVAQFFEGLAADAGRLVQLKTEAEDQQRQRHHMN